MFNIQPKQNKYFDQVNILMIKLSLNDNKNSKWMIYKIFQQVYLASQFLISVKC